MAAKALLAQPLGYRVRCCLVASTFFEGSDFTSNLMGSKAHQQTEFPAGTTGRYCLFGIGAGVGVGVALEA